MAIYHCSMKSVSRGAGHSAVAAAAYRAGEKLKDKRTGEVHDYSRKQGVEYSAIYLPPDVKGAWAREREQLWSAAELAETRKNSRVGRELVLALPCELVYEERRALATQMARYLATRYGVAVDVALHKPSRKGDERNFHAHLLLSARRITSEGFKEKTRELDDKTQGPKEVEAIREEWASLANVWLQNRGRGKRIDHRSLKAQGQDRMPTLHLGASACALERKGIKTRIGDRNRQAAEINAKETLMNSAFEAVVEPLRAEIKGLEARLAWKERERERLEQEKREREKLGQEQRDEEKRQELAKQREDLEQEKKREKPEPKPAPRPVKGIEAEEKRQEAEAELAKVMRERLLQKAKRLFSTEEREKPEPKLAPRPVRTVKVIDDEDEKDKKESRDAWETHMRRAYPDLWKGFDEKHQQYEKLEKAGWTETKSEDEERRCRRKREEAEKTLQNFKAEAKGLGGFLKCLFQREERQARERQLLDALAKARDEEEKAKKEHQRGLDLKRWEMSFRGMRNTQWKEYAEGKAYEERHQAREAEKKQIREREQKLERQKKRGFTH